MAAMQQDVCYAARQPSTSVACPPRNPPVFAARPMAGMQMDSWVAWLALSVAERRQLVSIKDPVLVCALRLHMQGIWQAEMRQHGSGIYNAEFDRSQLRLARSLEFCVAGAGQSKTFSVATWPADAFADPAFFPAVVQVVLGADVQSTALSPKRWAEILQPAPTTWLAFERCLAKLVQQAFFRAKLQPAADADEAVTPSRGAGLREAVAGREDENCHGLALHRGGTSSSRAAKRQRQRERRKLARQGKTGTSADNADSGSDSHEDGTCANEGSVAEEASGASGAAATGLSQATGQCGQPVQRMSDAAHVKKTFRACGIAREEPNKPSVSQGDDCNSSTVSGSMSSLTLSQHASAYSSSQSSQSSAVVLEAIMKSYTAQCASSLAFSSTESRTSEEVDPSTVGGLAQTTVIRQSSHTCGGAFEQLPSFSVMDSLRAQLQIALADLEAGKQESCRDRLRCAMELTGGLEPYLESVHKPMSEGWQRLKEAAAEVDWREKFTENETQHLFHSGMGSAALTVRTLQFLSRLCQANRALQVGMYTGQSALGLAEALPATGRVIALERDPFFVDFVRKEFSTSPHGHKISVQCGHTQALMQELPIDSDGDRFDIIFVDGSKSECPVYVDLILERGLLAKGGILAIDDVLWKGGVYCSSALDNHSYSCSACWPSVWPSQLPDQEVASVMAGLNERIAHDKQFEIVVLPIHNGLTLIRRVDVVEGHVEEKLKFAACPPQAADTEHAIWEFELDDAFDELLSSSSSPKRLSTAPARISGKCAKAALEEELHASVAAQRPARQSSGPPTNRSRRFSTSSFAGTSSTPQRQVSVTSMNSAVSVPFSRVVTGQATPDHLWPATPDASPGMGPSTSSVCINSFCL